ncbi:hypothetical protein KS4_00150 [Poriferisphaera corsica]|uniref:Uncharacterized protein n=1 Tax=Poriferisphaera corsica TaxID=2528020 RepID=A0A517YP31_9BACT|nr:hypothetical protein [Poriferisphaera corsica]QDU31987.1 hypothetical protein KS4_00150 [Poriferisphaera corsica]
MKRWHLNFEVCVWSLILFALLIGGLGGMVWGQSLDELLGLEGDGENVEQKEITEEKPSLELELMQGEDELVRMLRDENPADLFEQVIVEMRDVGGWLKGGEFGDQTQRGQREIVLKLDQIIAQAKQNQGGKGGGKGGQKQKQSNQDRSGEQQAGQKKGQGGQQGKAQRSRGENKGQAGVSEARKAVGDEGKLRESRSEWGQLPERVRKEIEEGMNERYSVKYRRLTELYYKRLVELQNEKQSQGDQQ